MTHKMHKQHCCACNKLIDAATSADGDSEPPGPGDITICVYCGEVLEYQDNMDIAKLSEKSFASIPDGTQRYLRELQANIRSLKNIQ